MEKDKEWREAITGGREGGKREERKPQILGYMHHFQVWTLIRGSGEQEKFSRNV